MTKKAYMIPSLKTLDVNEEQLLISISVDGGADSDDVLVVGGDGDADSEGLGKGFSAWDEE